MTKQEALARTKVMFTNLMDGKVISGIGVKTIIDYYESLIETSKPTEVHTTSNILQNFIEDDIEDDIDFMTDSEF